MSLTLPETLLTTLQAAFDAEAKRLARDAAKVLRVPEKEMLQILKKVPKVQFKICDDQECNPSCSVLLQRRKMVERCRMPCLLGTGRCIKHQDAPPPPELDSTIQKRLTRIQKLEEVQGTLWCDEETREVYDAQCEVVGYLTEDNVLELDSYETQ